MLAAPTLPGRMGEDGRAAAALTPAANFWKVPPAELTALATLDALSAWVVILDDPAPYLSDMNRVPGVPCCQSPRADEERSGDDGATGLPPADGDAEVRPYRSCPGFGAMDSRMLWACPAVLDGVVSGLSDLAYPPLPSSGMSLPLFLDAARRFSASGCS